ncbi:MAG: GNAT family N-acetyltransferase [Clostridia bacterium]|nr:GNAT family N-acetyltransferase [Clostridia bacterium]
MPTACCDFTPRNPAGTAARRCDADPAAPTLLRLADHPGRLRQMAFWFHEKWRVPLAAYLESMEQSLGGTPVPRWYAAMEGERIVGGLGVIENDFHDRPDLAPNVCAVYVEPDRRGQGLAGRLLRTVCRDMAAQGVDTLYLVTDHEGFYERYGWEFFTTVTTADGPSRLYRHRIQPPRGTDDGIQ